MAAGKGSRMGSITGEKPKSFIKIHGRTLLEYNLELLFMCGVSQVIIVTGYKSELFEDLAACDRRITLAFNPFYESTNVLCSFWVGMYLLADDFIYLHADTLCDPGIMQEMVKMHGDIILPIDFGNYNEEAMGIRRENGRIVEINKKIPLDQADGEFIGIAMIRKSVLPMLRDKTVKLMKEMAFSDYFEAAIQRLIDEESFSITTIPTANRFWVEMDFEEDYEKAKREFPSSLRALTNTPIADY